MCTIINVMSSKQATSFVTSQPIACFLAVNCFTRS